VTDAPNLYQKARTDVATMLGYDLDALTPEQSTCVDVATALRVLLDNQSGRLVRGESLDARELLMASEALSRLLPPLREPAAGPREDPREVMWQIYKTMRERGELNLRPLLPEEHRIAELEGENARLKARLAGEPDNVGSTVITPPTCDITPPSERAECDAGPLAGPDDPPPRSTRIIEAVPNPPAASAAAPSRSQNWDSTPGGKAWRAWVDAGSPGGGDRWANNNR
jgi:hypothetical protein